MSKLLSLGLFVTISIILWQAAPPVAVFVGRIAYPEPHEPLDAISTVVRTYLYIWTAGLVFAGAALYTLKRGSQLLYGLVEIGIAIVLIYGAFEKSSPVFEQLNVKTWQMFGHYLFAGNIAAPEFERLFGSIIQLAVALYVLVGGLDNTGEGLRKVSRAKAWWDWMFPV